MKSKFAGRIAASVVAIASPLLFAHNATPGSQPPHQHPHGTGMHHAGGHRGDHSCCGPTKTSGWSMMNRKERDEHREQMRSMKSYDECKVYADEHHKKMMERATERGRTVPSAPRADPCAWLKK